MTHTMTWVEKHCEPFVTYDDEFQIWKQKNGKKYWAYDVDEEGFIEVKLVAQETFPCDVDEDELYDKYDNDWCGEVDLSYNISYNEETDEEIRTFDYAWFEAV